MTVRIPLGAFALIVASIAPLAGPAMVSAHARLSESSPAVGAVLQTAPAAVTITFSNDIQKIQGTYGIEVQGPDGADVTAEEATLDEADRSLLSVPLQPDLPQGRYVVTYTNVSDADGDPFEGGFAFYVGVEPTTEQLAADALLEPPEISATQTSVASNPGAGETPEPTVIDESASATPDQGVGDETNGDDDDGAATWVIVGGAVVVIAVVAGGIWLAIRGRNPS